NRTTGEPSAVLYHAGESRAQVVGAHRQVIPSEKHGPVPSKIADRHARSVVTADVQVPLPKSATNAVPPLEERPNAIHPPRPPLVPPRVWCSALPAVELSVKSV